MARIAVGGFQHETNTFAVEPAGFAAFESADAWPGLVAGAAIAPAVAGMNLPIAGILAVLAEAGHEIVPLLWCAAQPSGPVTEDAYECIAGRLLDGLRAAGPVDGVCLDLHGAMVAEHVADGEGELLRRIRDAVGPSVPVTASLDLHANIGAGMAAAADFLTAYRTYPHIDMAATGARAAQALDRILSDRAVPAMALRKPQFLIPLVWQCSLDEPAKGLYRRLAEIERETGAALSFAPGFPLADVADCGPAILAYGETQGAADSVADGFAALVAERRADFAGRAWPPADAVAEAMRRVAGAGAEGPVVLADAADNPGAGATCATAAVLGELIRQRAAGAVLGLLFDPAAARAAHAAGTGATIGFSLGEEPPVVDRFRVERLGDGRFTGTGPFYQGARMELGAMALLRHESGVRVVVASRKQQAADQAMFRHLGVDPAEAEILVLKSSVHYRADFEPIAQSLIVVDGPGAAPLDPAKVDYRHVPPAMLGS